ncbi:MAG: molybdopterin-dependent oxidoreductase, partial [Chloroflexota bacterium]|nr:molybdopterin-dependent oxidoreductase [Chloroflexota bacterium]
LALLTGNVGEPGAGLYPVRQGANEQGAWDVGCIANRLPGRGAARNERARNELEEILQCSLPAERGLALAECLEGAADGRIKAMALVGDSPNLTNGRLGNCLDALDKLDFLVVMDTFLSEAARRADVVLPRVTMAEKTGSVTNLERRVQRLEPAFQPGKGEARSELWMLRQLAQRLGVPGFDHSSAAEVMEEIARVTPVYAGVSHAALEGASSLVFTSGLDSPKPTQMLYAGRTSRGMQWPVLEGQKKGTATLYSQDFPMGRANLVAPEFRAAESVPEPDFPAWLAPGRVLLQRDRDSRIELDAGSKRNSIARTELIELNAGDGAKWSVAEGDLVRIESAQAEIAGEVRFNATLPTGVIGVTGLFGQLAVELEGSDDPNPMARTPGLDVVPARIVKDSGTQ